MEKRSLPDPRECIYSSFAERFSRRSISPEIGEADSGDQSPLHAEPEDAHVEQETEEESTDTESSSDEQNDEALYTRYPRLVGVEHPGYLAKYLLNQKTFKKFRFDWSQCMRTAPPPIQRSDLGQILDELSQDCRVVDDTAGDVFVRQAGSAHEETDEELRYDCNEAEFSEFQRAFTRSSAMPVPFTEALEAFKKLDIFDFVGKENEPSDRSWQLKFSSLCPKPWQISDSLFMQRTEDTLGGGIIANPCGLGKTITALLHIVYSATAIENGAPNPGKPTLVVLPTSALQGWILDWRKFFGNHLDLRVWHGEYPQLRYAKRIRRGLFREFLAELPTSKQRWDGEYISNQSRSVSFSAYRTVIITTYETLRKRAETPEPEECSREEYKDPLDRAWFDVYKKPLPEITWACQKFHRVILDEGQNIRNTTTLQSRVVRSLAAEKVWIMTANPLLNRATDLLGYLRLLARAEWSLKQYLDDLLDAYRPEWEPEGVSEEVRRQRWWVLDPNLLLALIQKNQFPPEEAEIVLPAIANIIQLRRPLRSKMDLGDGTEVILGGGIPAYNVKTLEITHGEDDVRQEHDDIFQQILPALFQGTTIDRNTDLDVGNRSSTAFRLNSMVTSFLLVNKLMQKIASMKKRRRLRLFAAPEYAGLSWIYQHTNGLPPQDRAALAKHITKYGPKFAYLCRILKEVVIDGKRRLIINVYWPVIQWVVIAFLKNLGFKVKSIMAWDLQNDRMDTIASFNDPQSDEEVLVLSYRISSHCLNLQYCCRDFVFFDYPESIPTLRHSIGRGHRVGQNGEQNITILSVANSFDTVIEGVITRKMICQMRGELELGDSPDESQACAEEMTRRMLGRRSSAWLFEAGRDHPEILPYLPEYPPATQQEFEEWLKDHPEHVGTGALKTYKEHIRTDEYIEKHEEAILVAEEFFERLRALHHSRKRRRLAPAPVEEEDEPEDDGLQ